MKASCSCRVGAGMEAMMSLSVLTDGYRKTAVLAVKRYLGEVV